MGLFRGETTSTFNLLTLGSRGSTTRHSISTSIPIDQRFTAPHNLHLHLHRLRLTYIWHHHTRLDSSTQISRDDFQLLPLYEQLGIFLVS